MLYKKKNQKGKILLQNSDATYAILHEDDIDETVQCILSAFSLGEVKCKALGVTKEDGLIYSENHCRKAAREGLSLIARENKTDKIIGFQINRDFTSGPPEGTENMSPKLYPIMAITDALEKKYREKNQVKQGELLYQLLIGVLPLYSQKNIGFKIASLTWDIARAYGFKGIITECSGSISQHLAIDKAGYKEVAFINYNEFVYFGQKVFQHITDCRSTKLLIKML
ncbi:MAG TPA: hypothetical protein PK926_09790 [Spirochaetota bacterium]|nr:hypothetical protein [Spirochaetota bacterium]HPI88819.1 hypothetical protein [Spirochaetota bacterium]HPR47693.1 hypothetical protein [Spirochaetota bacterium]